MASETSVELYNDDCNFEIETVFCEPWVATKVACTKVACTKVACTKVACTKMACTTSCCSPTQPLR